MARDIFGRDQRGRRDDDPEIRVTDRRRIQLDDDENADQGEHVTILDLRRLGWMVLGACVFA